MLEAVRHYGDGKPTNPIDLEVALVRAFELAVLRQQMRGAGLAAAGRLTWDAAAQQMIEVMQQIVTQ